VAQPAPYGIGALHQPGYVPLSGAPAYSGSVEEPLNRARNLASWLSLVLGVVAMAITFSSFPPGSVTIWILSVGVLGVLCGLVAILWLMRGRATNLWAPILGILFGLGVIAVTLSGLGGVGLVNAVSAQLFGSTSSTSTTVAPQRPVSPEPFVFASNESLTESGTDVQQVATAINQRYAGGNATLAHGQVWPQSLTFTPTQMLDESGTPLVTVSTDRDFTYTRSPDQKSYSVTVSSEDLTESAVYDSAIDRFTFACPASDTNCVPSS
jgi:hypothetical protein